MRYPGGKNAGGAWQRIVNLIPPHRFYIEPFLGSGPVLRFKRPAERSLGIDLDPGALAAIGELVPPRTMLLQTDALRWLESRHARRWLVPDAFLYVDPPYLADVCRSRLRYRHVLTYPEHERLLDLLRELPCRIMVSGYSSVLYNGRLAGWRTATFDLMTRGGRTATEWLWMNYAAPTELHDYRFLGDTFRQREVFGRMRRRWVARFRRLPELRRRAILAALEEASAAPCDARGEGRSRVLPRRN